jgi:ATP-dependent exoDNAse (exonuclease V) beta subunit
VEWVNECFSRVMPSADDIPGGAVKYASSEAVLPALGEGVGVHPFFNGDRAAEARTVVELAHRALESPGRDPARPSTVAILVRSRAHLQEIVPRLREAGLAFRAIEIEPLGHRPVVQDLLALTRALSHLADSTAWLAVLRAPWCGLALADLVALGCAPDAARTPWGLMNDEACVGRLGADGRERLVRVREVMGRALAARRRGSLRLAVEGAWLALGGPACLASPTELEEADIYLDHLETSEAGGALRDMAAFESGVDKLFALPDLEAPERLQVMTIH